MSRMGREIHRVVGSDWPWKSRGRCIISFTCGLLWGLVSRKCHHDRSERSYQGQMELLGLPLNLVRATSQPCDGCSTVSRPSFGDWSSRYISDRVQGGGVVGRGWGQSNQDNPQWAYLNRCRMKTPLTKCNAYSWFKFRIEGYFLHIKLKLTSCLKLKNSMFVKICAEDVHYYHNYSTLFWKWCTY